jgi:hypothetical protein
MRASDLDNLATYQGKGYVALSFTENVRAKKYQFDAK